MSIIYRHQAEGISEAAEAWKADHYEAMAVCDLEDVIEVGIALVEKLRVLQANAFKALFSGDAIPVRKYGLAQQSLYEQALSAFTHVEEAVRSAEGRGHFVKNASAFSTAFAALRGLSEDFARRWPQFDRAAIEAARQRGRNGEHLSIEEFERELLRMD